MYQRATEIDPNFALAWAGVADCYTTLNMYYPSEGDVEQADAASLRALELDPELPEAHAARAWALSLGERYVEAEREFQAAIALDPQLFEAKYFFARTCFQQGKLEDAARLFEEACRVREDYQARFFAAQSLAALKRSGLDEAEEGLRWAERALEIDPEDAGVRYNVACLYAVDEQVDRAITCLEEAIEQGFWRRDWIERDPDLDSLRDDPRFQAIMRKQ
jgi:tetratricopeptide (TPR) repeat protein